MVAAIPSVAIVKFTFAGSRGVPELEARRKPVSTPGTMQGKSVYADQIQPADLTRILAQGPES
jgi:hypothetical protein